MLSRRHWEHYHSTCNSKGDKQRMYYSMHSVLRWQLLDTLAASARLHSTWVQDRPPVVRQPTSEELVTWQKLIGNHQLTDEWNPRGEIARDISRSTNSPVTTMKLTGASSIWPSVYYFKWVAKFLICTNCFPWQVFPALNLACKSNGADKGANLWPLLIIKNCFTAAGLWAIVVLNTKGPQKNVTVTSRGEWFSY